MQIDIIYIPCYKPQYRLTRICVASIRYWYPNIPIVLVKDLIEGNFDTSEIEQNFNVTIFPQHAKSYGWGFSKFEVFFEKERKRFLMLDSDIVLVGPILSILEKFDEDWIVYDEPFTELNLFQYYFNPEKIKIIDPDFIFPNFTFNTGQIVGTTGILKREEFDKFIEWKEPRIQLHREAFTFGGEQPFLNYILMKKYGLNQISLRRLNFMREGLHQDTQLVSLNQIIRKEGYPFIIHWHDKKPNLYDPVMKDIPRNDILLFFEDLYYRGANVSYIAQSMRIRFELLKELLYWKYVSLLYKLKRLTNKQNKENSITVLFLNSLYFLYSCL